MRTIIYSCSLLLILMSCENKPNKFQQYFNSIPDLDLPYSANSYEDNKIVERVAFDSVYKEFNKGEYGALGKKKISDSAFVILHVMPGDIVYPGLTIYTQYGEKIDELSLLNLLGGSDGMTANSSSFLKVDTNFRITIIDTLNTFERDTVKWEIIDSTLKQEVFINQYSISPSGKIIQHALK